MFPGNSEVLLALLLAIVLYHCGEHRRGEPKFPQPTGNVKTGIDLTKNGDACREKDCPEWKRLNSTIGQLELSIQKMMDWVGDIAHDLKTPIGAIQGYAEILQETTRPGEDRLLRYTEAILSLGDRMQSMLENLSQISQVQAKNSEKEFELFSLSELVSDIVGLYRLKFQEKGLGLKMPVPKSLCLIRGYPAMVERAIQNVLQNAFQYSLPTGEVKVVIEWQQKWITLSISNSSRMPMETEWQRLYERYQTGTESLGTGSGLGLAIVKSVMELHEGDIRMESTTDLVLTCNLYFPSWKP